MSQTRIMSIHRLLMRLFSEFCGGKAINGKCQSFCVWPDLWRHRWPRGQILSFIWKISSRPFHCRLNFSPTSVGFRDRWGGRYAPPPQQRVGAGLGPAGRGLNLNTLFCLKWTLIFMGLGNAICMYCVYLLYLCVFVCHFILSIFKPVRRRERRWTSGRGGRADPADPFEVQALAEGT